jgi:membrane-bound lytic murein transglycosylase A
VGAETVRPAEPPKEAPPGAELVPIAFADLPGWTEDDHREALRAFRRGAAVLADHPPKTRGLGISGPALAAALDDAASMPAEPTADEARQFFETRFAARRVVPAAGGGFFTGYYEPVADGSRTPSGAFRYPLYRVPDDLVEFDPTDPPPGLIGIDRFAQRTAAGLRPYPDRGAIEAGYLAGRGLELVHLADPVDAFFIHIQGAARIRLADGSAMRVTYAAKTGHPYTPIGRILVERGALTRSEATMQGIRAWLAANPGEAPALMAANRSFIFFREAAVDDPALGPVAAAKVALTAGRSLAVDRLLYGFHLPVFVDTMVPAEGGFEPFRRLMIAQDTGSAIVGPARGDIFFGSGNDAGSIAGRMRAEGGFTILVPRDRPEGGRS